MGKETLKRDFKVLCCLFLILGGLAACALLSDDQLVQKFNSHRNELDRLVAMSNEDAKVIRIAHDFTRLENNWAWPRPTSQLGFSEQRWNDYKNLFAKVGIGEGLERDDHGDVFFVVTTEGLGNGHGSCKGIAYVPKPLPGFSVLPSLDDKPVFDHVHKHPNSRDVVFLKKLESCWYLYRE